MKKHAFSLVKLAIIAMIGFSNTGCTTAINRSLTHVEAEESYNKGDFERSFRLTEAMAYQGDKKAQYTLGYMYFYGIGTPKIPQLGIAWMQQSALKGYAPAQVALSMIQQTPPTTPAVCMHQPSPQQPPINEIKATQIAPVTTDQDKIAAAPSFVPSVADSYIPAIAVNSYIPPLTEADRVIEQNVTPNNYPILVARANS